MRCAELTLMDRQAVFAHDDNYPLTVTYQGRTERLDRSAVGALLEQKLDFVIDDREVELALFKYGAC